MDTISLLVEEHNNIKKMLRVTRKLAIKTMETGVVDFDSYGKVIDFVRNYADKHHHNKEEEILFKKMSEELDPAIASGPITAMFSEHDLGRLFIYNLENALKKVKEGDTEAKVDVIANAVAYTDLLYRHIEKEDSAIYTYGAKNLKQESLAEVERKVNEVEEQATQKGIQDKYLNYIKTLEYKV